MPSKPANVAETNEITDLRATPPALPEAATPAQPVKYSVSPGLAAFLHAQGVSFAFSSYQSGRFYLVGVNPKGGIMINERVFQKAMGISVVSRDTLILATLAQIHRFENTLGAGEFINTTYDTCYVPRVSYTTGALDVHDVGLMADGRIVFVNTRFNCLATVSDTRSFKPVWTPPFISSVIEEDRCHLNGMAMEDGRPAYVTAVSRSDTIDGWRDRRADGGVVIEVATGKVICEGLSMPHSPRVHNGKLWVLNSGTGELGWIDRDAEAAQAFRPVAFCPGFARGLGFHGKYAFVGLSKPRYERFEGLALDAKLKAADSEPWCGLQIIDLDTGRVVEWLRLDGAIGDLYDAAVIPGARTPMALGFLSGDIAALITHEPIEMLT
ncbi:MAG: TIGR03032 family protein [Deltaproteobacteria bacterium]